MRDSGIFCPTNSLAGRSPTSEPHKRPPPAVLISRKKKSLYRLRGTGKSIDPEKPGKYVYGRPRQRGRPSSSKKPRRSARRARQGPDEYTRQKAVSCQPASQSERASAQQKSLAPPQSVHIAPAKTPAAARGLPLQPRLQKKPEAFFTSGSGIHQGRKQNQPAVQFAGAIAMTRPNPRR